MARARNIKPGYFLNDELCALSPLARILFAGLWCIADREGRLEDKPKRIKIQALPYDDCNVEKLLNDLFKANFIVRYQVNDQKYIQVVNFTKHQNPHKNETYSVIPPMAVQAPEEHSTSTVQVQEMHGTTRADSLNPITDSLNLIPSTLKSDIDIDIESDVLCSGSKEEGIIPFQEIISYLNLKAGTSYRHSSKTVKANVTARWNEKYSLQDFYTVIDNKCSDWLNTEQAIYLRPETLFGNKFDSYLNQPRKGGATSGTGSYSRYLQGQNTNSPLTKEEREDATAYDIGGIDPHVSSSDTGDNDDFDF